MRRTTPAVTAASANGLSPPTREARGEIHPRHPGCGLSPPTRGSQGRSLGVQHALGSIPAHTEAGSLARGSRRPPASGRRGRQPKRLAPPLRQEPEVCNFRRPEVCNFQWPVTMRLVAGSYGGSGLSPPTRGSPARASPAPHWKRSIPAHTGKPPARTAWGSRSPVYPRPHGEASVLPAMMLSCRGLSPPTRGSRRALARRADTRGSIPAHTGKPRGMIRPQAASSVYPRPHGEASYTGDYRVRETGLSPPTRGSHNARRRPGGSRRSIPARPGSIPAHTGKPGTQRPSTRRRQVYPRPHGEARVPLRRKPGNWGLSPPTRGSRRRRRRTSIGRGSIPAHTGKPRSPL